MAAVHPAIGPAQACTTISGGKVLAVLFNKLAKFSGEKASKTETMLVLNLTNHDSCKGVHSILIGLNNKT